MVDSFHPNNGPAGGFDRTLIYPTHNAPIRLGDQLLIFYTGGRSRIDREHGIPMSIGLARVGRDRFAGLASWRSGRPGRVITRPVEVAAPGLDINVESFELNPIRVAVRTPEGTMLPGYGFDECRADYDAQRIYTSVCEQSKRDLSELRGKTVELHFEIQGAALYAYRFVPPPNQ